MSDIPTTPKDKTKKEVNTDNEETESEEDANDSFQALPELSVEIGKKMRIQSLREQMGLRGMETGGKKVKLLNRIKYYASRNKYGIFLHFYPSYKHTHTC